MLVQIAKEVAVNPKQVMFIGVANVMDDDGKRSTKTVVFIMGCPKGVHSDHDFETTVRLLNGDKS